MSLLSSYWIVLVITLYYLSPHVCRAKHNARPSTSDQNEKANLTTINPPSIPVHNDTSRDNEGADHDTEPLRNNGRGSHEANSQNYAAETNGTHGMPVEEFQQAILNEHNQYRLKMCADDLQTDSKLHEAAQKRAHNEANARKTKLSNDFNENVYVVDTGDPSKVTSAMIVKAWYDEYTQYDVKNESSATHFSQLVWKNSKSLGVGHAYNGQKLFIVALYKPPGNIRGLFQANVGCGPNGTLTLTQR